MQEKEPQERLEGEQEGEELGQKEEQEQEGEEQEGEEQEGEEQEGEEQEGEEQEGEEQEGEEQEGEEQEGEEQEREPDQNQLNGYSTPHSEELPEQIRLFEIHFNRSIKRYTIATLQKSVPPWYDLDSEPDFTLQGETFKQGDFVSVKLYDKNDSNDEDDIAYINDIKALPRPDQPKLVLSLSAKELLSKAFWLRSKSVVS
jgi:hypothetical protein